MTVAEYEKCVQTLSDNLYRFALKSLRDEDPGEGYRAGEFPETLGEPGGRTRREGEVIPVHDRLPAHHRPGTPHPALYDRRYAATPPPTRETGVTAERAKWCNRYLDQLPEIQRTLSLLRDYEGYSYQEMADMTSLSVAQVKVYIFRARMALKQQIGTIRNLL